MAAVIRPLSTMRCMPGLPYQLALLFLGTWYIMLVATLW